MSRADGLVEGETVMVGVGAGVPVAVPVALAVGRGLAVAGVIVAVGNGSGGVGAMAAKDARTAREHGLGAGVMDPCCPASLETLIADGEAIVPPTEVREASRVEKAEAAAYMAAAMHGARMQGVLALNGNAGDAPSPPIPGLART